jgi:hypothetical protein
MVENINNRHADRATNKEPVNNSIAINCTSHAIRPEDSFVTIHHQQLEREPAPNETEAMCGYATCTTRRTRRVQRRFLPRLSSTRRFSTSTHSQTL